MINWFHTFQPTAILFSAGPINIYWYGLCLVTGVVTALSISFYLAKYYEISRDTVFDLSFWLIIGGLVSARIYDVLLELPYYLEHPGQILAIWRGGLAIHGAIIAGVMIVWLFARRKNINFFKLSALLVPGLALGQAIGRWGNYFNQELFGRPTSLSWGIPINILNRPTAYINDIYFHPTFFYESLGCLMIFLALFLLNVWAIKRKRFSKMFYVWSLGLYMILYSILRFTLEFIKIDTTPYFLGMRWPQIISLTIIAAAILLLFSPHARSQKQS
ncbi:MAG: prolipoprotein diacylglyceryl transferase [Candidatus Falkowbacteria bacterium]|nr:prolipoprotein diacylglyceryl transferase [Candidatus Falkowbacteria bacterium]